MLWWMMGLVWAGPNQGMLEKKLDRAVRRIQRRRLAGTVVLVSYQGETIYYKASGWQNRQTKTVMQLDTLFRMYSLSKPLTSAAVMTLVDGGRVDLNMPIATYIPELSDLKLYTVVGDEDTTQPTVADCLRHSSGFTYGIFGVSPVDAKYNVEHPLLAEDSTAFVNTLAELPLAYEPGTAWRYSVSTDVLGVLVERVSGETLEDYMSHALFKPLGMVDTSFSVPIAEQHRLGPMYTRFRIPIETVEDSPFWIPIDSSPVVVV